MKIGKRIIIVLFILSLGISTSSYAGWVKEQVTGNYYYVDDQGNVLYDTTTPDGFKINKFGICEEKFEGNQVQNNANNTTNVNALDIGNKKVGDSIYFGKFYIKSSTKKDPVEWVILNIDRDNNEALLHSKDILLEWKFHDFLKSPMKDHRELTWGKSDIRRDLNDYFYNETFDELEKKIIKRNKIINSNINDQGLTGGNDTRDRVFLLNEEEYLKYINPIIGVFQETNHKYVSNYAKKYADSNSSGYDQWLRGPMNNKRTTSIYCPTVYSSHFSIVKISSIGSYLPPNLILGVKPCIYVRIK